MKVYKPDESHVSQYENAITFSMDKDAVRKALNDVQWMLQTDSYRHHYLPRLKRLELELADMLNTVDDRVDDRITGVDITTKLLYTFYKLELFEETLTNRTVRYWQANRLYILLRYGPKEAQRFWDNI